MKRAVVLALLSTLLFSTSIARLGFVNLSEGNPYSMFLFNFKIEPITDMPVVTMVSPRNGTTVQSGESIAFNVAMPESWEWRDSSHSVFVGQIKSVTCSLDQNQILYNDTRYGLEDFFVGYDPNFYVRNITYAQDTGWLSLGLHNLTVLVEAYTLYCYQRHSWRNVSVNTTFSFMVVASPAITSLSIENATYGTADLPLVFSVDAAPSWSGYSLDGQVNVTAIQNVTLTDLAEGNHSLVIYANDTFGNMGRSDVVFFNVSLPISPLAYLADSPIVVAVILVSAAVTNFGLVAYFLRRKKRSQA